MRRISRAAVPTLSLMFTAETAHRFGLIPLLHSHVLADVNNFERDLRDLIIESEVEEHPSSPYPRVPGYMTDTREAFNE
ncbi:hypothetical protein ONE63_001091 [Megalurothrips usitatus]|uniref:Uncharacterized protein n=1 Tax=Megalurothrips usitatus TaxID=439358 RepID=A0AAV7XAZ6_9NEOP|nr:hypothetical protein ONE63_001091 [Megalurothrips usitatus]